jgi:hypothetical protein
MYSVNPYKIRNMTMKNFVDSNSESASKKSPKNTWAHSVTCPMINWDSEGGGSRI